MAGGGSDVVHNIRLGPDRGRARHVLYAPLPYDRRLCRPEDQLCFIDVVRAAAQLDALTRCQSTGRIRLDMVKLQEPRFGAPALRAEERTPSAISCPDLLRGRAPLVRSGTLDFGEQAVVGKTGEISVWRHAPL